MSKLKYDPETFPILAEGYARDGLLDKHIWENLNLSKQTYYNYQKKYPEFREALRRGRGPVNIHVENALLKSCLGHTITSTKKVLKRKDGKILHEEVTKTTHYFPPNVDACKFWLSRRMGEKWRETTNMGDSVNIDEYLKKIADAITSADG